MSARPFAPITWNADERTNADGSKTTSFTGGWRNFLENSQWKTIDHTFSDDANTFFIDKAPYNFFAPKVLSGEFFFENRNAFNEKTGETVRDGYVGKHKAFQGVSPVSGVPTPRGILYKDAFPFGDLLIESHQQRINYLTIVRTKPGGTSDLQIPFIQQMSGTRALRDRGNKALKIDTEKDIGEGLVFGSKAERRIVSRQAYAWDSSGRTIPIAVRAKVRGNTLHCRKIIPRSFLDSAVYPIYTDTTDSFTSDTADRGIVSDNASFASYRAGSSLTLETLNNPALYAVNWKPGNYVGYRSYLWWATGSTIPSGNTISAASLDMLAQGTHAAISRTTYLVENRQASTALATSDWSLIGASGVGTGTGQPFASVTRSPSEAQQTKTFTINSDGLAKIAKGSGNTFYMLISAYDWDNSAPPNESTAGSSWNSADNASNKPTLYVTHTPSQTLLAIERTPVRGIGRGIMRP